MKLSILIPTHNRPRPLLRLLSIIKTELLSLPEGKVNVEVRDNSDSDETKSAMAESGFTNLPWLNYQKNQANIGFDNNILSLFCEAHGEFVWLVGDDDIIYEGSILKVLELLELNPTILHLPFRQPQGLTIPQYQQSPRIKYWKERAEAVAQILKYIKITSFVYKRATRIDREKLQKLYGKTGWMHLILGFEVISNADPVVSITLAEFFAGSLDTEWKTLEWTPAANLSTEKLRQHDIFQSPDVRKQLDKFQDLMYLGGIQTTLEVTSGLLFTKMNFKHYLDFGKSFPFKATLLRKPHWLLKFIIIKLKWGPWAGRVLRFNQQSK